ncbi:hypothetical protein [Haloferax larsenii]|uniref:hypothetical protein n=1 Tax=Haloferax larsenii TaxID=302484 RepID=UPI00111391E3|nr:hypothetical protein [Haloferax larsenii]
MDKDNIRDLNASVEKKMGRRRFTSMLGAAGFGPSALGFLTQDDFKKSGKDKVPIVLGFSSDDPSRPSESLSPVKKTR